MCVILHTYLNVFREQCVLVVYVLVLSGLASLTEMYVFLYTNLNVFREQCVLVVYVLVLSGLASLTEMYVFLYTNLNVFREQCVHICMICVLIWHTQYKQTKLKCLKRSESCIIIHVCNIFGANKQLYLIDYTLDFTFQYLTTQSRYP